MALNSRLVRTLAWTSVGALAVLLAGGIAAAEADLRLPDAPFVIAAVVGFAALLWLWVYWLCYFHRCGRRREFWLCYCLPFLYSTYRSFALQRLKPDDAA